MKCVKNLKIEVLKSNAGYYIGTQEKDPDIDCMCPNCRISVKYWENKDEAEESLKQENFKQRECPENLFCSKGKPCF